MSAAVVAAVKKIAVYLAADKRTWKAAGWIIGITVTLVLLPVMILLAMGNQFSAADTSNIDYSQFMQSLSPEQKERFSKMEDDGKAIEKEMEKLGIKDMTVKAQMIYLTYFDDVHKDEDFLRNTVLFSKRMIIKS